MPSTQAIKSPDPTRVAVVLSSVENGQGERVTMGTAASPFGRIAQHEERWRAHVDGICSGNADSLAQLYDETSGILYGLAVRVLSHPEDAEEVVLDVYQYVWRSPHTFDSGRGTVFGWLTVLTRSRAIDKLRRAGARRSRETPIEAGWETASLDPQPESETILAQERKLVQRALATLAPDQREAIELAFFRGLTHVEVAEALGLPLGTIKTRIRIGMRKLRDVLAPAALH